MNSIEESILVVIKKSLKVKYNGCGRTSYKEKTYYKLYSKQRPSANSIIDILFAVYNDVLYSVLLINLYSILIIAYSNFSHSVLLIVSFINSYILVVIYNDFSYNISFIILFTNLYSILSIVVYSKFINKLTLSIKYLFSN